MFSTPYISYKMTNKMQLGRVIYYSLVPWLLYMFRVILLLIIRSSSSYSAMTAADNNTHE